jgi:hypothetical protein
VAIVKNAKCIKKKCSKNLHELENGNRKITFWKGKMMHLYNPDDPTNDLPLSVGRPQIEKLSDNARRLYDILPVRCWMTKENLARAVGCRTSVIKSYKEELEAARLIAIHFHNNSKRSNPRHEIVKLSGRGTPICKHIKKAVAFGEWAGLDRNNQIELYLKSNWNIVPLGERAKRPTDGYDAPQWKRTSVSEKMDFFFKHPNLNVGLVICNHMMVVDVDTKNSDWLDNQNFQNTLSVSTPRGYHFYFRNDAVVTTSTNLVPSIDTRGPKNFIVMPPSIHPTGEPYQWMQIARPVMLPVDFRREWRQREFESRRNGSERFSHFGTIQKGTRNDILWRYRRSLRSQNKNYFEIECEMLRLNSTACQPPLSAMEITKLAEHVWSHPNKSTF